MDSTIELGDSESSLCRAVMAAAPDAMLMTDLNGKVVMANDETEALFGYPSAELLGESIELLVPEALRARHEHQRKGYVRLPKRRRMGDLGRVLARHRSGESFPVSIALAPVRTHRGHFVVCVVRDEREAQAREDELRRLSTTDPLTGVYNRGYFEAEVERLERGRRAPVGVIIADIDALKQVNDGAGHAAGDALIRRAAVVMRDAFRAEDVVARIGGDEFAVLIPEVGERELPATLDQLEAEIVRHNGAVRGRPLRISIGGASAENPGALRAAIREADAEMYKHKALRRA